MSEGNEVKWLYPGAEESVDSNTNTEAATMADSKESLEGTSVESSPTKKTSVTEIGEKMTAASSYMGSLFQNSWYGGKVKTESETAEATKKEATEGETEGEEKVESSKESLENSSATATATTASSAGSATGIAKSTSAFFSSLVSGVAKVASPTEGNAASSSDEPINQSQASSKSGGLGMLSSAFSGMSLPGSITGVIGTPTSQPQSPTTEVSSETETPVTESNQETTQQNQEQFSFTNAFSKVGLAATSYGKVLQDTVAPIFQDFNQEQQNFIKSKEGDDIPISPWSSYQNEDELKEKILCLSTDQRNFLRAPPAGVEIEMDSAMLSHHALFLLKEDPRLETVRYELVPKQIKEDDFWKNYFYRVGVLQQSYEMKPVETIKAKSVEEDKSADESSKAGADEEDTSRTEFETQQDDEFISDSHQVSTSDLLEADEAMKKLGLSEKGDAEWEAELEGELEYEMIEGGEGGGGEEANNPEWEEQIQEMLDAEESAEK